MTLWCPHHSNPPCATVREEDWAELKQQDYGNLNMLVSSTLAATTADNKQFLSLIQSVHKNVRKNGNKLLTRLVRCHYYPGKEDDDLVRSASTHRPAPFSAPRVAPTHATCRESCPRTTSARGCWPSSTALPRARVASSPSARRARLPHCPLPLPPPRHHLASAARVAPRASALRLRPRLRPSSSARPRPLAPATPARFVAKWVFLA